MIKSGLKILKEKIKSVNLRKMSLGAKKRDTRVNNVLFRSSHLTTCIKNTRVSSQSALVIASFLKFQTMPRIKLEHVMTGRIENNKLMEERGMNKF